MTLSKNNFHHRVASIFDLIDRETTARIDATSSSSLQGLQISYQPKKRLLILRCLNPCLIHSCPSLKPVCVKDIVVKTAELQQSKTMSQVGLSEEEKQEV